MRHMPLSSIYCNILNLLVILWEIQLLKTENLNCVYLTAYDQLYCLSRFTNSPIPYHFTLVDYRDDLFCVFIFFPQPYCLYFWGLRDKF